MEIVISEKYGGYGLSEEAHNWLLAKGHPTAKRLQEQNRDQYVSVYELEKSIARNDPYLVACVKELGSKKASSGFAKLKVVEVSDDLTKWEVHEYDGYESINHRTSNGVKLLDPVQYAQMKGLMETSNGDD